MLKKSVVYIDMYENGERKKSIGFVKTFLRDDKTRLQLQINGLETVENFVCRLTILPGKKDIGEFNITNGRASYDLESDTENFNDTGLPFTQIKGVQFILPENKYAIAKWEDTEDEIPKNNTTNLDNAKNPANIADDTNKIKNEEYIEYIPREQSTEYAPREQNTEYAPSEQNREYAPREQNTKYAPREQNREYAPREQNTDYEPREQDIGYIDDERNIEYILENENPEFMPRKKNFEYTPNRPRQDYINAYNTNPVEMNESEANITANEITPTPTEEGIFYQTSPEISGDKWKQLSNIYTLIKPFGAKDTGEYIELELKDFIVLNSKYQVLVRNSFLLHGYYNYKKLLLAKKIIKEANRFFIGVPGNYYDREISVASMFGFEGFEAAADKHNSIERRGENGEIYIHEGTFGYYWKEVEI